MQAFPRERYPLISQLIQENRIPEFDALYLDMNGIIHNCSHPNDDDASFRISEEDIFLAVFSYVAHLFSVIKPQKLFFLAIDGVAPRAKMNQQRSRRFRTAKENKETVEKAKRRGEEIPDEAGFDSNCITPGTPFMARLSQQLKYFIAKKVSEDADWRNVEIVLSGHEVPGEGEHKIMEYIRLNKAQPGYSPNMRHCMYGLDADLIMLGLLSHDPHFCLLREEVTFGPRGGKGKAKSLHDQNFFLMHLGLFREYLDHEFEALKGTLPFEYDLERIIDDFILINIFIGNDFLPHLPGLHINEGALNRLFEIYKRILPKAGGYLNEHGKLNAPRLQLVLDELTVFEREQFEHETADVGLGRGGGPRSGRRGQEQAVEKARARGKLVLTEAQKKVVDEVSSFVLSHLATLTSPDSAQAELQFPNELVTARERRFLADLADALKLSVSYDAYSAEGESLVTVRFDEALVALAREEDEDDSDEAKSPLAGVSDEETEGAESSEAEEIGIVHLSLDGKVQKHGGRGPSPTDSAGDVDEPEWMTAIRRVLAKYAKAEVIKERTEEEAEQEQEKLVQDKIVQWKKDYYKEKLEFAPEDPTAIPTLAYRYIEGLQWVLHYYYRGVASWGWFYNYHYAPKMSDLKGAEKMQFSFELGKPFKPFEQLMGVLPDLSSQHIPAAFRDLMSDPASPIIDFYPAKFEQDMNGKKQEWEAIVKIPFIDEDRLLKTMAAREPRLTPEERARNTWGESTRFVYDESLDDTYPSSLPGFFPDLVHNHTRLDTFHLPTLDGGLSLVEGLLPGALLGKEAVSGFPSLHTIPHTASLGFHGVNVFQTDSRRETMVVSIDNLFDGHKVEDVARRLVGRKTHVGYPYLREALVEAVSDELFRYELDQNGLVKAIPHTQNEIYQWKRAADRIEHVYSKSKGCMIGRVEVVVHAKVLKGLELQDDGSLVKEWEDEAGDYALQATVSTVAVEDERFIEQPPVALDVEYPAGSKVFFLGHAAYGTPAQVMEHEEDSLAIRVAFFPGDKAENAIFKQRLAALKDAAYYPSHAVARMVGMSGLALSKITSSLLLYGASGDQRVNVGLNLKFEAKGQKVLGFSRKGDNGMWEFSGKAVELIRDYKAAFPEIAHTLDTRRGDLMRATDFFPAETVAQRMKELTAWIKEKGVRDLEKVPLYAEQLDKDAVQLIEKLEDQLTHLKTLDKIKQARIRGIPRQSILKPAHAPGRLRNQAFALGDRVVTVAETGSVPLSAKGVVVGIQSGFIDVVFDVQFMGGTTLGGRCSTYRGATVTLSSVLNLTNPQFSTGQGAPAPAPPAPFNKNAKFRQGTTPGGPNILPAHGLPAGGFHPAQSAANGAVGRGRGRGGLNGGNVQIMRNPRAVSPATSFHAVATGAAGPVQQPLSAAQQQQQQTQQQRLGQTLGIRGGGTAARGRGGFAHLPFAPGGPGAAAFGHHGHQQAYAPVQLARGGVAIPPPPALLNQGPATRGGRGGMRGGGAAARGGRGGAARGGAAQGGQATTTTA
ncbi:XRN 5'-3' exonuclease N-terminus-domain-containing protein [Rhodotorula diobovata]|uniref:5'-3' exoribonuclease 1 n=1 Tax=Rhodotorula diobovata TaxID=5288 RepID=A0A5C5FZT4_9BASI|nr:XRN 5'-3' exonuclease N-terminus-domain-containing protein [Rhodotorula diobovata]